MSLIDYSKTNIDYFDDMIHINNPQVDAEDLHHISDQKGRSWDKLLLRDQLLLSSVEMKWNNMQIKNKNLFQFRFYLVTNYPSLTTITKYSNNKD